MICLRGDVPPRNQPKAAGAPDLRSLLRSCYTPGMEQRRFEPVRKRPVGKFTLLIILAALVFGAGSISGYVIEYEWWKEMEQTETWFSMLWYIHHFEPTTFVYDFSVV